MTGDRGSITILTEYFHPEEASTAQLLTQLSNRLIKNDFDVAVITSYPYYHDADRDVSVSQKEQYNGIDITRVRSTRLDKDFIPFRLINWASFLLLSIYSLLRDSPPDALLVLSNPPILPFVAYINKRLRGTPYAYLIHDMYPDMPIGLGYLNKNGIVAKIWKQAIRAVYRDADRIIVLGKSMEERLAQKMEDDENFDPDKIEIIPNWEDPEFITPTPKSENEFAKEMGTEDTFTLIYSGNIGRYHELETTIEAFDKLNEQGRTDIQFLIIGEGAQKNKLEEKVAKQNIENIRFLPFQPLERVPETLTAGDASLVGIVSEMEGICVSSKLYSSLATGNPVLAVVGENDEVARVVRNYECGAHVEPGNAEKVAEVLIQWADNPSLREELGENARNCFENNYTIEHSVEKYEEVFEQLL